MALVAGLVGVDAAAVWMDAVFAGEDFIEAVPVAPDGDIVAFALEDGGAIGLGEVLMAFVAALVEDFRGRWSGGRACRWRGDSVVGTPAAVNWKA